MMLVRDQVSDGGTVGNKAYFHGKNLAVGAYPVKYSRTSGDTSPGPRDWEN